MGNRSTLQQYLPPLATLVMKRDKRKLAPSQSLRPTSLPPA